MDTGMVTDKKVHHKGTMLIRCPRCGNDSYFVEVADGVLLTTRYVQNDDGSFTQESDESQVLGDIHFFCGECNNDLTHHHQRFLEMLF
jgi:hypothetical protein